MLNAIRPELVDRYFAAWSETDAGGCRALIEETWAIDASSGNPLLAGKEHHGIDTMIIDHLTPKAPA